MRAPRRGQRVQDQDQDQVQVQDEVARSIPTKLDSSVKILAPKGGYAFAETLPGEGGRFAA